MNRTIRDTASGATLASAASADVLEFEGNLYFPADAVDAERLVVTDDLYTCPYKGTCNWVDVKGGASHVAWLYPETKPGYEQIAGRYGFYAGRRGATEEGSA